MMNLKARATPSGCSSLTSNSKAQKKFLSQSLIRMAHNLENLAKTFLTMTRMMNLKATPTWSKFGSTLMTATQMKVGSSNGELSGTRRAGKREECCILPIIHNFIQTTTTQLRPSKLQRARRSGYSWINSTPNENMTLSRSRMMTGQMLRTSYGTHLMDLRMMVRPFFRASTKTSPRTPTSAQTLCTSTSTLTEIRRGLAGDWSGKLWWVDAVNIEVSWDMNHVLNLLNVNKAIWDTNCLRNFIK